MPDAAGQMFDIRFVDTNTFRKHISQGAAKSRAISLSVHEWASWRAVDVVSNQIKTQIGDLEKAIEKLKKLTGE